MKQNIRLSEVRFLKKLRKRKIAKQYGITYKRFNKINGDFHYFHTKGSGFGCYFVNDSTFLNVIKNKDKWGNLDFKFRIK